MVVKLLLDLFRGKLVTHLSLDSVHPIQLTCCLLVPLHATVEAENEIVVGSVDQFAPPDYTADGSYSAGKFETALFVGEDS